MSVLEVKNLQFRYEQSESGVLSKVNLEVFDGQCVFIFGLNGSGKSTLALALSGVLPKISRGQLEGHVEVLGKDVFSLMPHELVRNIGLVMQDPDSQTFFMTVYDELAYPLRNLGLSESEIKSKIRQTLEVAGLSNFMYARPDTLSHGQKQLLALFTATIAKPKLLILDEPTAYLDEDSEMKFMETVKMLKRSGTSIVIFDSWPNVPDFADSVYSIVDGELVEGIEPNIEKEGIDERPRSYLGDDIVFSVENMTFRWNDLKLFEDVGFLVRDGATMLMGRNGSGKSTLTKLLMGIIKPQSGSIRFKGRPVSQIGLSELGQKVGYLFQNPEHQLINQTVLEEVIFSLKASGHSGHLEKRAFELLERFELYGFADRFPLSLSASEKKRLALATLMAAEPEFLILDEIESSLDPVQLRNLASTLEEFLDEDRGILLTAKKFYTKDGQAVNAALWLKNHLKGELMELENGKVVKIS